MKVYTVIRTIRHDYDCIDTNISGVFSSKEKAINAILKELLKQYIEEVAAYYTDKRVKEHGNSYLSACLDNFRSSICFESNEHYLFESIFLIETDFYCNGLNFYGVAEFDLDALAKEEK